MSLPRPAIVQSTIYLWCFRLPYDKQPFLVSDILMAVRRVQPSSTAPAGLHATPRDVIGPDPSMRRYPGVVVLTHPPQREKERKKKNSPKTFPKILSSSHSNIIFSSIYHSNCCIALKHSTNFR